MEKTRNVFWGMGGCERGSQISPGCLLASEKTSPDNISRVNFPQSSIESAENGSLPELMNASSTVQFVDTWHDCNFQVSNIRQTRGVNWLKKIVSGSQICKWPEAGKLSFCLKHYRMWVVEFNASIYTTKFLGCKNMNTISFSPVTPICQHLVTVQWTGSLSDCPVTWVLGFDPAR